MRNTFLILFSSLAFLGLYARLLSGAQQRPQVKVTQPVPHQADLSSKRPVPLSPRIHRKEHLALPRVQARAPKPIKKHIVHRAKGLDDSEIQVTGLSEFHTEDNRDVDIVLEP